MPLPTIARAATLRPALVTCRSRAVHAAAGAGVALAMLMGTAGPAHALPVTAPAASTMQSGVQVAGAGAYVTSVYGDLFGRNPDRAGLATWTSALANSTPRVAVANAITSSAEYRTRLIAGSYEQYLARTPDSQGSAHWLAAMGAGMTIHAMEGGFLASPEYYLRAGNTDSAWVAQLYRHVLDRTPSPAEVSHWKAQLRAGASRQGVAMGFLLSSEHLATVIDAEYRHLLGRSIDPTGRAHWVAAIQGGARLEAVIGGIIASDEYYGAAAGSVANSPAAAGPNAAAPAPEAPPARPTAPRAPAPAPAPAPVVAAPGAVKPGPTNTGVPTGTRLTVHHGDLVITTPGTVIDAKDIRGLVIIKAPDVTIKRSIIRGRPITGSNALIMNDYGTYRYTLEDSELTAAHPSPYINGIIGANFTVKRTNIHGVIDQIHITGDNVTVESSWLHDNLHYTNDPQHPNGSHDDNVQVQAGRNITLTGNTMTDATNAALQITQDRGTVADLTYTKNWADNGGCTLNIAQKTRGPLTGLVITDNTFGKTTTFNCAILYPATSPITFARNLYTDGTTIKMIQR